MPPRKAYHHGDLRSALLNAAIKQIAEVGPAGFTLREVARRAGVSHNAPYRHFRDKDELMAAVAAEGFLELTRAMRERANREHGALKRLNQSGLAYVDFALRHPEHFTVMFDVPAGSTSYGETAVAGEEAFGTLVSFVRQCQQEGSLPAGDPLPLALRAWSIVHGVAKLATAKRLPFKTHAEILKFASFVIDTVIAP
jgi:AcrR family transcriptional regulator